MATRVTGPAFLFIFAILVCSGTAAAQGGAMAMSSGTPGVSTGQTRTYYIVADAATCHYHPVGMNQLTSHPFAQRERRWPASPPRLVGQFCNTTMYRQTMT